MRRAFSLVELSIVLVILGLLVGGILAGKSLIKASQLRASAQQLTGYMTATYSFKDKYFAWPGEFEQGYQVFGGGVSTICGGDNTSALGCNGLSEGYIASAEAIRAWMHLKLANLISEDITWSGSYSGWTAWGTNYPKSKLKGGYSFMDMFGMTTGMALEWVGSISPGVRGPVTNPEDMWNIDRKYDDGLAQRGKILAYTADDGTEEGACLSGADYDTTNSGVACWIRWYFAASP